MGMESEPEANTPEAPNGEAPGAANHISPATLDETGGIIELLHLRPPAYWMRSMSDAELRTFVRFALASPRSVLLLARAPGDPVPAGYVFAVFDPRWFWASFAVKHSSITRSIVVRRALRLLELRREIKVRALAGDSAAGLPPFSWSPSHRGIARIIGLYVRKEHRRKGIAMSLYFKLFDALKEKECFSVEEYMGPDYPQFAGKFPEVCGWRLQQCSSGGYKISKNL
jgi:GNAT superfamily N-acetyltransferase